MLADESDFIRFCDEQHTQFKVRGAVLLHTSERQYGIKDDFNVSALTYHKVENNEIQMGDVIDKSQLIEMLKDKEQKLPTTFIEAQTLIDSTEQLVWFKPSMRRPMRLMKNKRPIQFNVAKFPATLFVCNKRTKSLSLYGLASDHRPTPDTQLYRLPVGNVSDSGRLCLGSGSSFMPEKIEQINCDQIEKCFFDALSTHTSCNNLFKRDANKGKRTSYANMVKYWLTLAETNQRARVNQQFIPLGSINDLIIRKANG